jgi:hypothetical protein
MFALSIRDTLIFLKAILLGLLPLAVTSHRSGKRGLVIVTVTDVFAKKALPMYTALLINWESKLECFQVFFLVESTRA